MSDLNDAEVFTNITNEYAQNVLRVVENDDKLEVLSLKTAPLVKKGENYTSIVLSVDVETKSEKNGDKVYNLVAKLAPADPGRRQFLVMLDLFQKENHVYNKYFPELVRLQTRRGVSDPIIPSVPRIFVPHDEKEMILLFENLKPKGFRLADKLLGLDYEHCKIVLEELARLHALSYVLIQDIQPEKILEKFPFLADKFDTPEFEEQGKQFMDSAITMAMEALDALGPQYAHLKKKLDDFKLKCFEKMSSHVKRTDGIIVGIHGDCWVNNMMFRYDDDSSSGKPSEMKFVDLQMTRVVDCCVDLNYFFYTSTTKELRDEYMYVLLKLYQEEFRRVIKLLNAQEPLDFTWDNFKTIFDSFKEVGLVYALSVLQLMLARPDETVNMENLQVGKTEDDLSFAFDLQDRMKEAMVKMVKSNTHYSDRLTGVLQEMEDNGVLQ